MWLVIFWSAFAIIAYTYALFPCLVFLRGRFLPKPFQSKDIAPHVNIVIAAHNEQHSIAAKIENLRELEHPAEKTQIIIASDGSTDETEPIVAKYVSANLKLLALPRQGKAGVLNAALQECHAEIVVFSDANSMFRPDALKNLLAPFADDTVGGVAGDQRYIKRSASSATDEGERSYWGFDRFLKLYESRAGNVISATGSIYAVRRSLIREVAEGVTDDFAISTDVVAQGKRLVFALDAASFEPVAERSSDEFDRKVRVITRGFRSLLLRRNLFNPFRFGFYSVQILSHKLLRRLAVFPLIAIFISSWALSNHGWLYLAATVAQTAVYGLAAAGFLLANSIGRKKIFAIPAYFVLVNAACLVAFLRLLLGKKIVVWDPQRPQLVDDSIRLSQSSGDRHAIR